MLKKNTSKYSIPQDLEQLDLYPYFRVIESQQDSVIVIEGKEVLMFGSNGYLGLTNHPHIKQASKDAIKVNLISEDEFGTAGGTTGFTKTPSFNKFLVNLNVV